MKPLILKLLIALLLSSCQAGSPTLSPISAEATLPPRSTEIPTPTEVVVTPTEAGPKEGDKTSVTENGYTYNYTLTNLGETKDGEPILQNVRKVADFFLYDWPTFEGAARFQLNITDKAPGERSLYQMTHKDFTMEDVSDPNSFDPPRITAMFMQGLMDNRGKTVKELYDAFTGDGLEFEIVIPDGTPEGKAETVNLSTRTGFIVTIMDPETMRELGGDNISTFQLGDITVLAQVYGVDGAKNELCRLSFEGNLNDIDDYILRQAMFVFPARLIEKNDQGNIGQSQLSIDLARNSQRTQDDGITLDLEIERVTASTPTITPNP